MLLSSVADLRTLERRARQSEEVLEVANLLERRVVDLETAQRGFIITRQEDFLSPLAARPGRLPREAATLARLVGNDPEQRARAQRIAEATTSYVRDYSIPLVATAGTRPRPRRRPRPTRAAAHGRHPGEFDRFLEAEPAWRRRAQAARTRPPSGPSPPPRSASAGRSCSSSCSPAT